MPSSTAGRCRRVIPDPCRSPPRLWWLTIRTARRLSRSLAPRRPGPTRHRTGAERHACRPSCGARNPTVIRDAGTLPLMRDHFEEVSAVAPAEVAQRHHECVDLRRLLRRFSPTITSVSIGNEGDLSESQRAWLREQEALRATLQNVYAPETGGPYTCPCCGSLTLPSRGNYDLCPQCDWEDDGQDDHDSAVVRFGPNGGLSLDAARAEYQSTGDRLRPHVAPAAPQAPEQSL